MKRRISVVTILAALVLLTACSRTQTSEQPGDATPLVNEIQVPEQEIRKSEEPTSPLPIQIIEPEIISDQELEEQSNQDIAEETEPWEWSYDMPENQGMNAAALSALHTTYDSFPLLSAVIVRNGVIVDTYCEEGYDETSIFTLHSTSKSITSALVGIAVEQGYIENIDVPLSDYFPELLSTSDTRWQRITLRHLLTHTSGVASTDSALWYEWRASENWLDYIFALPIYAEPGTNFDYSTGNTHLLCAILEQATGKPLDTYAKEVLFEPLGMTSAGVDTAPEGIGDGGNGFYMTTLDLARFGLLYLNNGIWQDQQIVPADWVEASTTMQAQRASDGSRYGYQWWVRSFGGHPAYVAQGHYGQYIIAVPELSLLIAMNSYYEGSSSIYWQIANDVVAACNA